MDIADLPGLDEPPTLRVPHAWREVVDDPTPPRRRAAPEADAQAPCPPSADDQHWRDIIGQIGVEVGLSLSSALERVTVLATTGRIDRGGLRALREEIERARRAGMIGQQLARFASGRIRQSPERTSLTQMMRDLLVQRGREATARQLELRQALGPAEVVCDPTLLHALLQALVDWSLDLARTTLEFRLDIKPWPPHARLACHVDHPPVDGPDGLAEDRTQAGHDAMSWRLVEQTAWTLGLDLERSIGTTDTTVVLEFPLTVTEQIEGVSVIEIDAGFGSSDNSKPLAGSHVLVVASRREVRAAVREATRHMGLLVDFVNSVEEAEEFCRDALPHAIVHESILANDRFQRLRAGILAEVPGIAFIEITPEGDALSLTTPGSAQGARIGRDAIAASLPSALLFELTRSA